MVWRINRAIPRKWYSYILNHKNYFDEPPRNEILDQIQNIEFSRNEDNDAKRNYLK